MTFAAVCVEGFWVIRKSAAVCAEDCSCVRVFEDLKGSAAECADKNCGFCRNLNKTQFYGRNPYTGGEPRYILCHGSVCCFCCVLSCINIYISDK